ncbi:MAG: energy transducer TonB [Planctomycetes bacterium]|nr:energy transducer TonB [Planctomycetota bacterium]
MRHHVKTSWPAALAQQAIVVVGAAAFTTAFFLVLPMIQAINEPPQNDQLVRSVETADVPPPPPPPEEEPQKEEESEPEPPQLADEAPPLDLSQLELALNPGFSDGWMAGDFAVKLGGVGAAGGDVDELFAIDDLDQPPRPVHQPSPVLSSKVREHAPGTVYVLFVVDPEGRVQDPRVQKSTDPVFDAPTLNAVKQWRFEPGKRAGKAVRTRVRYPISFPKS